MFVPMKEIVDRAYVGGYAVPALPSQNEVQIRATIEAAAATNSPLIFLTGNRGDAMFNHYMVKRFAEEVDIPVALCLDHSPSFEDCVMGIKTGCSAIMADRSVKSFEENVAEVSLLAKIAHAAGVSIEAELGHVGQGDNYAVDGVSALTDPEEARKFFELTEVDCLAVAVGTAHGVYVGTPHIDFERLKEINAACGKPLVLHGGSGSGDENISKACTMGITKVNIVTDVMIATNNAIIKAALPDPDARFFYKVVHDATYDFAKHAFELTGCIGKAASGCSKEVVSGGDLVYKE
jgi:fructose-bisphosphate aldolase class II